jgi:glucose/arabinose dehydrogenase
MYFIRLKISMFIALFVSSHLVLATTINYQDTYPELSVGTTIVGLEFITQLNTTNYGQASANGTESIKGTKGEFIAFDRVSNIYRVANNGSQELLLDTKQLIGASYINNGSQKGLQYAVPHPEFAVDQANGNGKIYTTTTENINPDLTASFFALPYDVTVGPHHYDVVSEWDLSGPTPTRKVLMVMETPHGDHNARWLGFDEDENLYISVGDGGNTYWGIGDTVAEHGFGQRGNSPLGSILRVALDSNGGYTIPDDNPYINEPNTLSEIYANGLRNPQQCWWDKDENLYCADIGQRLAEEVNHIVAGANYGWSVREGEYCVVPSNEDLGEICAPNPDYIDPLYAYAHVDNSFGLENRAIGGLAVCDNCGIDELEGFFINVDLAAGTLMAFNAHTGELNELLLQDLKTDNIGTYAELFGLPRVEARLGSCGDFFICLTSRRDDQIFRLTSVIAVTSPPSLCLFLSSLLFLLLRNSRLKSSTSSK